MKIYLGSAADGDGWSVSLSMQTAGTSSCDVTSTRGVD